jgi:hypothetical protein
MGGRQLEFGFGPVNPLTGMPEDDTTTLERPEPWYEEYGGTAWRYYPVNSNMDILFSQNWTAFPILPGFYGLRLRYIDEGKDYVGEVDGNMVMYTHIIVNEVVHIYPGFTTEAVYNVKDLLSGSQEGRFTFSGFGDETLTWGPNDTGTSITVTVNDYQSYTTYYWYLDNTLLNVGAPAYDTNQAVIDRDELGSTYNLSPGPHHITVLVLGTDGTWYSKRLNFTY